MHKAVSRESELQRAIGRRAVTALASRFPGQRIYVPWSNPEAMDRFMVNFEPLIGAAAVAELVDQFGGLRIAVPCNIVAERKPGQIGTVPISVERVAELTAQGLTAKQIASLLTCHPRTVHKARTKAKRQGLIRRKPKRKVRG